MVKTATTKESKLKTPKKSEKKVVPSVAKKALKSDAKPVAKKTVAKKTENVAAASIAIPKVKKEVKRPTGLNADVYGIDGKVAGTLELPAIFFASTINKQLITQAIRVYLANQREGSAFAKTRGQVTGSTRKIYKQKGTGNARHGGIRAPIFVGGGKALGPQPHSFRLEMPKKMKTRALASALTQQYQEGIIKVVEKLDSLPVKTKTFATALTKLDCTGKTLVLLSKEELPMRRALRNIDSVSVLPVSDVYTYIVMHHAHILITKEAIDELSKKNETIN